MKKEIRKIAVAGILVMGLSLTSCNDSVKSDKENQSQETPEMNSGEDMSDQGKGSASNPDTAISEENQVKKTGMAAFSNEEVADLYETYLEIKDALVETDSKAAAQAASHMAASGNGNVSDIAKQIAESDDINEQREAFSQLTSRIEPQLKGTLASGQIYKQYCPMAFEGKGDYWLSDSKQIQNPYFGDKMLTCGRTEETIQK